MPFLLLRKSWKKLKYKVAIKKLKSLIFCCGNLSDKFVFSRPAAINKMMQRFCFII